MNGTSLEGLRFAQRLFVLFPLAIVLHVLDFWPFITQIPNYAHRQGWQDLLIRKSFATREETDGNRISHIV